MAAATIDTVEIATQAAEAAGALASAYTGFKLLAVARDYYKLYQQQRDFYYTVFQSGVEAPLAVETFGVQIKQLDHTAQAATIYDTSTGPLGGQSGDIGGWWDRKAAMYNTVRSDIITALEADTARLQSDWANYLFRFEEHYVDVFNDIRFNRRLGIHNIGLKQGAYISAALSTSFSNYEDMLDGTADALSATANGAAMYAGYRRGLTDTYDDFLSYGYRQNNVRAEVRMNPDASQNYMTYQGAQAA
jgi:hypothetical protein